MVSLCVSVCWSKTVSCTKTAEPIEAPFELWTPVDSRNPCIWMPQGGWTVLEDVSRPIVKYREIYPT